MDELSRRELLKRAGAAGAAAVVSPGVAAAQPSGEAPAAETPAAAGAARQAPAPDRNEVLLFFNAEEAAFVRAAVDRLIPGDARWGGADEAGVLYYIDRQLASAYGAGVKMYLEGPWASDALPQQGYQLKLTPAELYRVAIAEVRDHVRERYDGEFPALAPADMEAVLSGLESGDIRLPSLPAPVFFETLLANTVEGYFSDPLYGGNRDMVSWRMIGFPGAYAQYVGLVDQHGYHFERTPIGISNADEVLDSGHGH